MRTLADFPKRQNSLNFLRLVFALLVIVSHAWPIGRFGPDPEIGQFSLGSIAVAGFFAISGWLITQSRMSSELASFFWRRFCRIYPGYLVVLLAVAFVFAPIGAAVSAGNYIPSNGLEYVADNAGLYTGAATVGESLPPSAYQAWNGSLWTLFHEVACYFVIGLMVTVIGRRRLSTSVVAALVISTAASVANQTVGLPIPVILAIFVDLSPFFFAGATLLLFRERVPLHLGVASVALAWSAIVVGAGANPVLAALPIAYLCMWAGATLPIAFQRVGRTHDISYGTYIYAFPAQQLIALLGGANFGVTLYIAASVAATLPLAALSWLLIERPAQNWRHVFDGFPLVRDGSGIARRRVRLVE